ncbi:HlyD family secretion protein [Noviherbaspirillum sp. UKPF54]|uniref:HlyD family secretion protein n=1 Tax=Noviherbaspirillum sp. UKPF54 TaxID=2601898 RepID=UPI0011B11888|nr:HlyD family secretion protein [Noviherbaspirillum sp. UKPF54]QDZ29480.1 HlyD family secretion protein [Noviherbaspirillum sp. UKPF54]
MDAPVHAEKPLIRKERLSGKKLIKWVAIAALLILAAIFGYRYWRHGQLYADTDNAYINANTVEIAAQVGGKVTQVFVRDNQKVKAGGALFEIDPEPYRLALEKAQAQLQLAGQAVGQQSAAVAAAEAQVNQRKAELQIAQSNNRREQQLVRQGFLSKQGAETARTQVATAEAALRAAQANLEQARSTLGATGERNATVQAAQAAVDQARLDLEHTHVAAPTDGSIANLSLRPGNTVQPGAPLFALIASQEYWADANFKETELERIRPGEAATVTVDMYPDHPFHGVVESVSGGAGTAFSLLPPQNATGNWVKVTQRVPVRVRITDPDPAYPLRIGTTATVEVAVRDNR